jgi:RNA polymerase sigma factor (sigma-70 family)
VTLSELPDHGEGRDLASDVADRQLLWQLLRTLPPRQRAALVLRYFHDMPDGEIAEALGCRVATVRSLVSRGVASMRRALDAASTPHAAPPGRSEKTALEGQYDDRSS